MRVVVLMIILFCASCVSTDHSGIKTEIVAKCTYNTGDQAIFESTNPNYSEIIIKTKTHRYKVGHTYVLILRK